ncbi:MAG TPA: dihydrolipoamide acetyltransferase family protein [Pirellulales bacterium]|nr:dihydrolipoamide acetyltransferase family protein [Pirellulales bacterium]
MAIPIKVPRLGWTMEEGVFVEWLKPEGATIAPGDSLFVLEGEKAAQEIESIDGGILRWPPDAPRPGQTVLVGAVLGYLLAPDESPPWESNADRRVGTAHQASGRTVGTAHPTPAAMPDSTHDALVPQTAGGGRCPPYARPTISPRARRLATASGIDWTAIAGTGRTGRIRARDVQAFAERGTGIAHQFTLDAVPGGPRSAAGRLVPLSAARRTIAGRMSTSARAVAPVTLTTKADATNLASIRQQFKAASDSSETPAPSFTDLIVKLAAMVLKRHPSLNASWRDDGIFFSDAIDIGIAVDTDAGLLAPVVRDVPALGLRQLAAESRRLIELARARRLTVEDLQGGTFTVTNLGMYGIDVFTPIVNLPQCAILGMGRIVREPAVVGDQIVPRQALTLSLTFDHRVVDGAPAARFLDALRQAVEQPAPWLVA